MGSQTANPSYKITATTERGLPSTLFVLGGWHTTKIRKLSSKSGTNSRQGIHSKRGKEFA